MSQPDDRLLILSERPLVRASVARAFRRLGGRPLLGLEQVPRGARFPGLAVLDLGGGPSVAAARGRLPAGAEVVALADAASTDRLIPALAAGCSDYLFFPVNPDEARLLWSRYRRGGPAPVLTLERSADGRFRIEFPSDARYLHPAVRKLAPTCADAAGIGPEAAFRLRVALAEAVSNAILYGNREDPSRRVRVVGRVERGIVRVTVTDEGEGFDPASVPDPTKEERVGRPSGRGLFLMRRLADEVLHSPRGNEVTLEVRPRPGGAP